MKIEFTLTFALCFARKPRIVDGGLGFFALESFSEQAFSKHPLQHKTLEISPAEATLLLPLSKFLYKVDISFSLLFLVVS